MSLRLTCTLLISALMLGCGSKADPEPKQLEHGIIETQPGTGGPGDGNVDPAKPKPRILPPK